MHHQILFPLHFQCSVSAQSNAISLSHIFLYGSLLLFNRSKFQSCWWKTNEKTLVCSVALYTPAHRQKWHELSQLVLYCVSCWKGILCVYRALDELTQHRRSEKQPLQVSSSTINNNDSTTITAVQMNFSALHLSLNFMTIASISNRTNQLRIKMA